MTDRDHFVYRAYDARRRLLYVGCTRNLTKRWQQHRFENRHWTEQTVRIRVQGPYPAVKARQVERAAQATEDPRYGATPDRMARLRAKRDWREARLHELLNGKKPNELPFDVFCALSDVANREADDKFPRCWNSNNHPVFGVPEDKQPFQAFTDVEVSA